VTGRATSNLLDVRLDRATAQDDPLGGDSADWAKLIRWGSPAHAKWACRDEPACQERQARRKETAGG